MPFLTGEADAWVSYVTYGAVLVSSRMFRFFKSCASGRCCKCFSSESRRCTGEIGVSSTPMAGVFSSTADILRYVECLFGEYMILRFRSRGGQVLSSRETQVTEVVGGQTKGQIEAWNATIAMWRRRQRQEQGTAAPKVPHTLQPPGSLVVDQNPEFSVPISRFQVN